MSKQCLFGASKFCVCLLLILLYSQVDEISDYQNARYVSSNEAVWRTLEFPIHGRDPPVQQLAVHLESDQQVYFTEETAIDRASTDPPKTALTEFFVLCQRDNFARLYCTWISQDTIPGEVHDKDKMLLPSVAFA